MKKLVEIIESERMNQNLSKYQLCKQSGVPWSTYNNWIKGKKPTVENAEKVLRTLGITYTMGKTK